MAGGNHLGKLRYFPTARLAHMAKTTLTLPKTMPTSPKTMPIMAFSWHFHRISNAGEAGVMDSTDAEDRIFTPAVAPTWQCIITVSGRTENQRLLRGNWHRPLCGYGHG